MWALFAPILKDIVGPLAQLFGGIFNSWMSYKAGSAAQKAATTENAIEQSRRMRDVVESRGDIDLDERRERLRKHLAQRP